MYSIDTEILDYFTYFLKTINKFTPLYW